MEISSCNHVDLSRGQRVVAALKRNGIDTAVDTAARYCCRYCSTVDTAARYTGLLIFWNTRHVVCEQTIKFDTSRRLPWSSSLLVYQSTTSTWSIWSLWSGHLFHTCDCHIVTQSVLRAECITISGFVNTG